MGKPLGIYGSCRFASQTRLTPADLLLWLSSVHKQHISCALPTQISEHLLKRSKMAFKAFCQV